MVNQPTESLLIFRKTPWNHQKKASTFIFNMNTLQILKC